MRGIYLISNLLNVIKIGECTSYYDDTILDVEVCFKKIGENCIVQSRFEYDEFGVEKKLNRRYKFLF